MPEDLAPTICTEKIAFPNGNEARLVKAASADRIDDLLTALGIGAVRMLILVFGGADGLDDAIKPRLKQIFTRAIARAAAHNGAAILDGGTHSGVMELLGAGVAYSDSAIPLIGVAPACCVTYPGHVDGDHPDLTPLDPNHSHFLLAPGDVWGNETRLLFEAAEALGRDKPVLTILVNGGEVAKTEVLESVRRGWPVLVIRGTGRLADQVVGLAEAGAPKSQDPDLAEIQAEGRITVVGLDSELSEIERRVVGRPAEDDTLRIAWQRFDDYDLAARSHQAWFRGWQGLILILGVVLTLLAILQQGAPKVTDRYPLVARILQLALIVLPILISVLIAWVSRFRQGNKWVLLRAAAESVKREIFAYRTRAGVYSDAQCQDVPREMKLARELENNGARLQQTEVNRSLIRPAKAPAANLLTRLTPADYLRERLQDQIGYFDSKTKSLELQLKLLQWGTLLLGGAGTFLAAIRRNVWIALTTVMATAITTKLETDQVETSLIQYNQSLSGLQSILAWWSALTDWEKNCQKNIDLLVEHTEKVLESELTGWVQQMQTALERLRKQQTEHESSDQDASQGSSAQGAGTS